MEKLSLSKQFISFLVLISFMVVVVFSFAIMIMHGQNEGIFQECPFTAMDQSLCPQDTVAIAFHHVASYQSFLNVNVNNIFTVFISLLILMAFFVTLIFSTRLLFEPPIKIYHKYDPPSVSSCKRKIINWLSLFENSPAIN